MKVKLVFDDWKYRGKSIYATDAGIELSKGDFHSGTTFDGEIILDPEQEEEVSLAMIAGFSPSFQVYFGGNE